MSKKLLWLFAALAATLVLVAAGCGSDDDEEGAGDTAASETSTGGGAAEAISVGLVTDIGGLNDRGFNELANTGLEQAESELGVEGRVLESKSDADYIPNLSTLAEEGSNLIVSIGFLMGEATHAGGRAVPGHELRDHRLRLRRRGLRGDEVVRAAEPPGPALQEQEVGYLAGYMAAKMSKTGTISTRRRPEDPAGRPLHRRLPGGREGSEPGHQGAERLLAGLRRPAPCKEIALDQISKGSDVVFQVAGGCGLGALDAAKEKSVWGIGVDKDQAFLGDHILTSAVKRVDVAVYSTIEAAANGEFEGGGVSEFTLDERRRRSRRDQAARCRRRSSTRSRSRSR